MMNKQIQQHNYNKYQRLYRNRNHPKQINKHKMYK